MTYNDIRKELANWIAFLRILKKDISSGQIRNYGNVLNALRWLGKIIRSLENVLDKKDNEIVRRKSDEIKNSRKELQGIVSHSISKPDSYIEVTERIDDLIDDSNNLSELLDEERQKIPASGGKAKPPPEKLSAKARVLAILVEHQGWSNTKIAKEAGINRTTLYNYPEFKTARKMQKQNKEKIPRGRKDQEGNVEAIDE
jgi:transcriptional regulator of acetoin/glycerol metabolism